MPPRSVSDGSDSFDVTVLEPIRPERVVLFGVGFGGNPERHLPLLQALADRGCAVVAPHFDRPPSPIASEADLQLRARRMRLALAALEAGTLPVAGVGHSLGATMLLGLAGAQLWTFAGQRVPIEPLERLDRLALLAPATDFVRAPGALDQVHTPIMAWAGTADSFAPPEQVRILARALETRALCETRLVEGAGHFSFMNLPPPQTTETLPDRDAFLADLAGQVAQFVMA
jgi:pimeloyl-ACP methyl ester carboxylesterase